MLDALGTVNGLGDGARGVEPRADHGDVPPLVVTVTPNPSLDLLFEAERLVWDDANRLAMPRRRAGGQGINVARAARALGGRAAAVAPLGGAIGRELAGLLEAERAPLRAVPIAGETRVFVAVRERATGRSLLLNPRGAALDAAEADALCAAVHAAVDELRPRWVAGCGSLPPGLDEGFYARVGEVVREAGAHWVPDCDGPALRAAADAGCDLLVPNEHEAARLLGRPVESVQDAAAAARELLRYGPALAAVTLGERGAVCATARGAWHAVPPAQGSASPVGAGDAFLAALLIALDDGAPEPDALRRAVAAGTGVLRAKGRTLVDAEIVAPLIGDVTLRRL